MFVPIPWLHCKPVTMRTFIVYIVLSWVQTGKPNHSRTIRIWFVDLTSLPHTEQTHDEPQFWQINPFVFAQKTDKLVLAYCSYMVCEPHPHLQTFIS